MIKRALVTGGTGVTGVALVRFLLENNIKTTAFIRPGSNRRSYLPENDKNLTIIECGMEDYDHAEQMVGPAKFDAFFHLAWEGSAGKNKVNNRNNFKLQNKNIEYTIEAVELCHRLQCPLFLATGSQAEYGRKEWLVSEDMEEKPENGYGMAKLCAGGMTRLLCKEYEIKHIWVRLFSIYGPFDGTESLIDSSIRKLLKGEKPIYTKGEQQWDYLYSFDAANALYLLAENGISGEVYNVGAGMTKSLSEYIKILHDIVAPEIGPLLGTVPYKDSQVMMLGANIGKLVKTTGFSPKTSFDKGIAFVLDSIKAE